MPQKRLFTLKEFLAYTGLGMTKARQLCKESNFSVRIGNKIFIDREAFDKHLNECRETGKAL